MESADSARRLIFETDRQRLVRYRAGITPAVEYVEGCALTGGMTERGDGRRLAAAMLVSVAVGAAIYWFVIVRGLPALAHRLSDEQILALRDGLRAHPLRVLGAVLVAVAVLALPVLVVFRLVYGPLTGRRESR